MDMSFSFNWRPEIKCNFDIHLVYSDAHGVNCLLTCTINGKSCSLGDWSGDLKHNMLSKEAYDYGELEEHVAKVTKTKHVVTEEFNRMVCWLVTVIIAEANVKFDHVFHLDEWKFNKK